HTSQSEVWRKNGARPEDDLFFLPSGGSMLVYRPLTRSFPSWRKEQVVLWARPILPPYLRLGCVLVQSGLHGFGEGLRHLQARVVPATPTGDHRVLSSAWRWCG